MTKYKINRQSVSMKEGTVQIPDEGMIVGHERDTTLIQRENGLTMDEIDVIVYLTKEE